MARRARKDPPISLRHRVALFLRLYEGMKQTPFGGAQRIVFRVTYGGPDEGAEVLGVDQQHLEAYLTRFRQLVQPGDHAYLGDLLRLLPGHVADDGLRQRLADARRAWKGAQGVPSPIAALVLGPFAPGSETWRLYLHGLGLFHTDPRLALLWDRLPEHRRQLVKWSFLQYESKVRRVATDLHHIIRETEEGGHWRDDLIDLSA